MDDLRNSQVRPARARRVPTKKIAGYSLAAVVIVAVVGFVLFCRMVALAPGDTGSADGIVVLTGGEARIPAAIKLLAGGKGKRLLISGVNPSTTRQELISLVPDSKIWFRCCIDVDRVARDTIGNANETQAWMEKRQFRSLIVVTASYHMPRSLAELRRALPDAELIPHPVVPRSLSVDSWWTDGDAMQLLASEYVKYVPALGRCILMQMRHGGGVIGGTRQCINGGYSE